MSLQNSSREELDNTSMLEVAYDRLMEEQKAMDFSDLYDRVADLKDFTDDWKEKHRAQFYTDLTVDGRFLTATPGLWGLKRWYPVEQMDEVAAATTKKKKSKKGQKKKEKAEEPAPREESQEPEREPDSPGDGVEVLTGQFADESAAEEDEFGEKSDVDDGFDDPEELAEAEVSDDTESDEADDDKREDKDK
ncbi:hypothetical protein GCM10028778_23300 [Barrientosiimonas marina]|uniref:Probable DNA-directed RNA polymerase subunit delta n=1 Tax=Lentibacillus kimchii TaxID=1542911 RepID=A0ABW2UVJ5_9BACI